MTSVSAADLIRCFSAQARVSDLDRLDFLSRWVRDDEVLYVDRCTGVVSADPSSVAMSTVDYWSNTIFTSQSDEDYNAFLPFARARLYYVFRTIIDRLQLDPSDAISVADFAAGQGVFLDLFRSYSPTFRLFGTEHSPLLSRAMRDRGLDIQETAVTGSMEPTFIADVATLNWTLSCCQSPYDVVMGVRSHLPVGGYMVIAESSRVLVPFKKSLRDLLGVTHPTHVHPWYFSAKSLCALVVASGFQVEWINRFFDSDVLLVIARKTDLPSMDHLIEIDHPDDVKEFFTEYARIDRYFEHLALIQEDAGLVTRM